MTPDPRIRTAISLAARAFLARALGDDDEADMLTMDAFRELARIDGGE